MYYMTLSDFIALCSLFIDFGGLLVNSLAVLVAIAALVVSIYQHTKRK